jgi:hypothetical protein
MLSPRVCLTSLSALGLLASVTAGCQIEYHLIPIEDPIDLCSVGCNVQKLESWINPNEASTAGTAVEIAAWGYDAPQPNANGSINLYGYTLDKNRRTAFAGAPALAGGRVYQMPMSTTNGDFANAVATLISAPAGASEFGAALLAAEVRNGWSIPPLGQPFTGPKAYGEELLVGAPGTANSKGSLYWYHSVSVSADPWVLGGSFVPASVVAGDRYGASIAVSHRLDAHFPDDVTTATPPWIAVGAPGGNKVFILHVDPTSSTPLSLVQTILGTAGTKFGTSLAIADFNRDGFDDLAVGAPDASGTGRVHIFTGNGTATPITMTAPPLTVASTLTGADEHGTSLAAGFFVRDDPTRPALVAGDPGRDTSSLSNVGAICQYQFTGAAPMTVLMSRCDAPAGGSANDRFGQAVAVGNFFATSTTGSSSGACGVAEEIAVGSPGEDSGSVSGAGAVRILALGPTGGEPGEPAASLMRGTTSNQSFGKALAADFVQPTIHEDLLIGSPTRAGSFGGMTITRAETPNGACTIGGTWTSTDSAGHAFRIAVDFDGSFLNVTMLNNATIRAQNGANVCSILGFPIDFTGVAPISPIPWTTCGVDHTEAVDMDISAMTGFPSHILGTLAFDASANTFTMMIDETKGVLSPMNNACLIVNDPFVFTQTRALVCD